MKSILVRSLMVFAGLFLTLQVVGCNTVEGAGKDAERVGEKVQDAAD